MKQRYLFFLVIITIFFSLSKLNGQIVISEIMYNPPESGTDSLEYIELYNRGSVTLNLQDYNFSQGVTYTFGNINLNPGEYFVLAGSSSKIDNLFGIGTADDQWASGVLLNGGETIELLDNLGAQVDIVTYNNIAPWPLNAAGLGSSIKLCDVNSDNSDPVNWIDSNESSGVFINGHEIKGSPGSAGVCSTTQATHLNFDGANDGITTASNLNFADQSFSIEFWARRETVGDFQYIYSSGTNSSNNFNAMLFRYGTNKISFSFWSNDLDSNASITDNNWHHYACTYNANTKLQSIYIDGVLDATRTSTSNTSANTILYIGSNLNLATQRFNGDLDEFRIWNTDRTAEQIAGSMNCELQGNESGLLAYYQFNQGIDQADNSTVTTLTDATTNANNGTLTNFVLTGSTSNWLAGSPVTTGSVVPSAPTVSTPVVYYLGDTASELTATQGANATGLLWYTSATGETGSTTAPTPSTSTLGSASYWVSSTNANGCESERVQIIVNVYLSNDECSDAINLTVGSSSFNDFPEDVLLTGATGSSSISNPSCGNYQGGDVWYTVTVPASGNLVIETDGVGIYDSGIEVYTGVCETLSLVACDDNSGNGNYSKVLLLGQTPGTVFYIRVWENFWGASNAQFQISAYDYVVPATHLNFDGVNDFVEVPKPFTSDFTIEYWVKTLSTGTTGTQWYNGHSIVDNEIGGVTSDFGTSLMGSKLAFGIGGPDTTILSTSDINNGTWNHVAVTWKQSTGQMQLYINGVLESTGTSSTAARTAANFIKIGTSNNFGSYFNGDVDELRIWNVVLSEEDIVATKDCELQPNQTNLLAYYKFNQGFDLINNASVTTLIDEINSNNGTLNNFTLNGATSNWKSGSIVTTGNTCPLVLGASSFSENKFAMYPNPTKGIFSVNTEEALTIEIYDIVGKLVKKQKIEIGTSSFDITALNSGMYLVKTINSENISEVFKLIKE